MTRRLHFDGVLAVDLDGSPAEVIGRHDTIIVRVARVSALRKLAPIYRSRSPMRAVISPYLHAACDGAFTLQLHVNSVVCAEVSAGMKPSWVMRRLCNLSAEMFWFDLMRAAARRQGPAGARS